MEQHHHSISPEISVTHAHDPSTKRIWVTFWILLFITVIELLLGLCMYWFPNMAEWLHLAIKGVIIILSLSKAFYIVSIFMHLGDEIRNMIMTIVVPLMLFIWFIIAFIYDGNSYKNLRNKFDKSYYERTGIKKENKSTEHEAHPGGKD